MQGHLIIDTFFYPMVSFFSLLQSEWLELYSERLGRYQLNKYTGDIQRDAAAIQTGHTHPQIDLINQAYRQVPYTIM